MKEKAEKGVVMNDDKNSVKAGKGHGGIPSSRSQVTPELNAARCENCKAVKHYEGVLPYVDVELCPFHAATPTLYAALQKAAETIRIWHGEVGWEIYESHSPEMKVIIEALALWLPNPLHRRAKR